MTGEDTIEPNDPSFHVAVESIRDLTIFGHIFDQLGADPGDTTYVKKVKEATKDSVFAHIDQTQSRGRDAQSELLLAANCAAAGFLPIGLEEPDVTCVLNGVKHGIAVKRLKTRKTIRDRISRAANQIERARLPGIIALDCTQALNPRNSRVILESPERSFALSWFERLQNFVATFHNDAQKWVRGNGVLGMVVQDHLILQTQEKEWGLRTMHCWVDTTRSNQRRGRQYNEFRIAYGKGLPNLGKL